MNTTFGELVPAITILENHINDEMSFDAAYKIEKILRKTSDDLDFFRKNYSNLLEECAEKTEDNKIKIENNNFRIKAEQLDYFNKKIKELLETKIEIDIPLLDPESLKNWKISVKDLHQLRFFLQ